jgi:hypothetical protein
MQPTPDPSQISALLDAALVPYAWVVAIAIEAIFSAFTADSKTWTPPAWLKAVTMLAISLALAYAKSVVAPVHDGTLASVWPVQALVFFTVAVLSHKAMQATYGAPGTLLRTASAGLMALIVAGSLALALFGAPAAHAGELDGASTSWKLAAVTSPVPGDTVVTRSILDLRNLAGGIEIVGAGYQRDSTGERSTAVELKGALSYGVTDQLSLAAGVIGSPWAKTALEFAGLRVCLNPENKTWQLGAGVDVRHYDGSGYAWVKRPTSSAAVVAGAWSAAKRKDGSTAIFFKAAADWDVDNGLKTGRLALAWQAFGGK